MLRPAAALPLLTPGELPQPFPGIKHKQSAYKSEGLVSFFYSSIKIHPVFVYISVFFFPQTLLSENNGVVDGPATDVQEHQLMSAGYQLLLQVLNTTFSW